MKKLPHCLVIAAGILLSTSVVFATTDKVLDLEGKVQRMPSEQKVESDDLKKSQRSNWIVQLKSPSLYEESASLNLRSARSGEIRDGLNRKKLIQARFKQIQTSQSRVISDARKLGELEIQTQFNKVTNGFVLRANQDLVEKLRQHPQIKSISAEKLYKPTLNISILDISANQVWDLQDANENNITGQGVKVAIVDTGVNYQHDDLGGCLGAECKVIGGYDFVNNDADPMEDDPDYFYLGHGTHVAGIVAAKGQRSGVAPDASILAYKVCDVDLCPTSLILAALERASDPDGDILTDDAADVVNISLGNKYGSPLDPVPQAINIMAQSGIVVVVAAGNDGGFANLGDIASAEKAITVAANNGSKNYFDDEDQIADFSSGGPVSNVDFFKPEVNAPGVSITAPCMKEGDNQANCTLQGTSMASPHVAGVVALLKQSDPSLSVDEIRSAIINTAQGEEGVSAAMQGAGLVNALSAVQNTLSATPQIAYFGDVRTEQPSYTQTLVVELKNHSDSAATYNLLLQDNATEGVVFSLLTDESILIEPGETGDVLLQVEVDLGLLKNTLEKAFTIENELTVSNDQDTIRVPVLLTPFAQLSVVYESWSPRNVTIFNQRHNSIFYSDFATSEYYLPLGDYSVISVWDESDALSFVVEEDIDLYTTASVDVSKDLAVHRVSISSVVDAEGQTVEISNSERRNTGFLDISYLPAKYSQVYGRDLDFDLIHKDLLFSEISENFELRFQTLHSSSFDESTRSVGFYSFVEKLAGIDTSYTYEFDAGQTQSQSFYIDAFDQFDGDPLTSEMTIWSRPKPEFDSATFVQFSGFGNSVLTLDASDEKVLLTEPYTMTVHANARLDKNNFDLGLLQMVVLTDNFESLLLAASADFSEQSEMRIWQEHNSWEAGRTNPHIAFKTGDTIIFEATHNLLGLKSEVYFAQDNRRFFHPTIKYNNALGQAAYGGYENDESFDIYCDDNLQEESTFRWRYPASENCQRYRVRGTFKSFIKDAAYQSWMEMGINNISNNEEVSTGPEITHVYTTFQGALSSRPTQDGAKLNVLLARSEVIDKVEIKVLTDSTWQALSVSEATRENGTLYSADLPIPNDGHIAHLHVKVSDTEGNYAEQMIQGAMVVGKDQSDVFTRDSDLDEIPDYKDQDIDGDEVENMSDVFPYDSTESIDTDFDGIGNNTDDDDDGDGVDDQSDVFPLDPAESIDTDGDGIGNNADSDDDNDATPDDQDAFPLDASETTDTDNDGTGNNADTDDDGDGVSDAQDDFPLDASRSTKPAPVTSNSDSGGGGSMHVLILMLAALIFSRRVLLKGSRA